jgi:hypothetical protein
MPLCPQITNTPITVVENWPISAVTFNGSTATYTATGNDFVTGNQVLIAGLAPNSFNGTFVITSVAGSTFTVQNTQTFAITAVSFTSSTATYTAPGHNYAIGQSVTISGLAPAGYNGTFTITSIVAGASFTVSNGTNATVTDQNGSVITSAVTDQNGTASVYVVSSVLPVVAATTTQVNAAQSTATTALADAVIAYNAAIGSLQPSASTIVNASNQMTAIAANGITVYSGSSASSGARVVMNSLGLAGFNSGGSATFSISASTGAAVFSGSVTGSTITGGTLNIAGNAIIDASGFLTASGATVTGAINATSGYIGSASNGWNFSSSGFLTNSGGSTILYPTTAPGGNANTYSIFTDRGVYAERLFITGTQATAVYSSGGLYALGALNVAASGGSALFAVNTSGAITAVAGITATGAITTSSNISTSGSGTITAAGTLSGASITTAGNLTVSSYIYNPGYQVSTSGGAARINDATTPTARLVAASGSSIRFKKDVVDISTVSALNPKLLLQVPVKAFKYREDYLDAEDERSDVLVPGFIAEELDAIYPVAVDHDAQGRASRWSSDFIVPGLLALVQDLYKEVKALKGE